MARHADLTRPYELDQIAAAAAPALLDLADAAPVRLPDSVRRGPVAMEAAGAAAPRQIVFIEGNVPDLQDLLDGLTAGVQAVLLNPDQDGVQQIAAYLTSHGITGLAGIDLVAHGADGEIGLGTATLSAATLGDYQTELSQIGAALAPGGAIQIYGCDVGEDAAGVALLHQLSQATGGADIAAASHLVGDAAGGGSFELDVNVGTIEVSAPFTSAALTSFKGELSLSTTVPQLYVVWSQDANGPTTVTRLEQVGINGASFVAGASIDLADASTLDINQLRGVAFDAPLDRYFLGQAADLGADFNSAMLFEGTIGAVAAPGTINISGSSSIFYTGLSFDAVANKVYVAEQIYSGLTSGSTTPMTSTIDGIGIYSFTPSATITAPVTPTLVINGHSTITGGGTLQGPTQIAVVPNTNLLIFCDDQEIFLGNGSAHIDVGNVLSHQWTTLTIPGSIISTAVGGAAELSVAVDATSATGGILFFTVESGTTANNGIFSAGYTITGTGTTQTATISGSFSTLYAGAAADFPTDIVVNPTVNNGTVTGNGTFYVSSTNGTIYAGNMAGGGTLTAVGDLSGGSAAAESLGYESTPSITPSAGLSYAQGSTVTLNSGLALVNTDNQQISSATIVVASTADTLHYTTLDGIIGSFSSGIETLTGTTTAANYQAALDSITFSSTAAAGTQAVNWSASDGVVIGTATSNITLAAAIALTAAGTVTFTGGGAAVHLDSTTTVSDTGNITGATIDINIGFVTGDLINFANTLGITGSYSSGTLTLSGATTAANYQTALDSITYSFTPANGDPTDAGNKPTRTIAWDITDAGGSATATSTVNTQFASVLHYGTTIVETGILAATETVAAGVMTLKNGGGTAVGSITVGSSLVSNDFSLTTLSGNTDIILNTVFGTYTSGVTLAVVSTTIAATGKVSNTGGNTTAVSGPTGTNWTLTNFGKVSDATGVGISLAQSGTVTNASGGTITALNQAVDLPQGGIVTNASGGVIYGGQGVYAFAGAVTVTNAGSIGGSSATGDGIVAEAGGVVSNQSTGIITGYFGILALNSALTVVNAGRLGGNASGSGAAGVALTGGGTVSNQSGGTISGYDGVYAVTIAPTVLNAGVIAGSSIGVYLGAGGTVTNASGGTISGTADAVTFAAGHTNRMVIDPGAVFVGTVNGGNTIGAGSISTLELASGASAGTLSGLGSKYIDFAASIIDSGSNWILSGANTLAHGITLTNSGTLTDSGTFTNAGRVTGAATGVILTAGAQVTNQSGGTIIGSAIGVAGSGAGTLVNAGVVSGNASVIGDAGVSLAAGGSVTNQSGGVISGLDGVYGQVASASVLNAGSIGGNTVNSQAYGIFLGAGGSVTNQSGGTITAYRAIFLRGGSGTVMNAGSIGGSSAPTYGAGINVSHGGSVTNLSGGVITGHHAVYSTIVALTVTNAGSIGGNTVNGTGVDLLFGGTLTNQTGGAISGGTDAVNFASGHTNRLVIQPGAVFVGAVNGGNILGGTSISTLELASSASTGTFTGLGNQFIKFAQVTVDAGAAWTLSGTQTGFATLTNAGSLGGTSSYGIEVGGSATVTVINQSSGVITGTADGLYVIIGSGAGTVSNSGKITGGTAGFAGINLSAGGAVTNASGGTIAGYKAGVLINGTSAAVSNAGSIGGSQDYGVWLVSGGAVTNASGGRITGGYATASAAGVYLGVGGTVTNQSGGVIGGLRGVYVLSAAATMVNAGQIVGSNTTIGAGPANTGGGVYLGGGGSVTNQSGGTISGYNGVYGQNATMTVVNTGAIIGDVTDRYGVGVDLGAGGSVTNQSGGTITGYSGVLSAGAATVVNAGVIAGNYTANSADGVYLGAGGAVTNQVGGTIYGGNDGVLIQGGRGTVLNLGTISTADVDSGRTGIYLGAGGVVINGAPGGAASTATIIGYHHAIQFGASGTDTLVNYGTINSNPGGNAVSMYTGTLINGASGATGALIESGFQNNAVLISGAGTVVNYGSINGVAVNGESHISFGVSLGGSGSVASSISNLGANALISGYVAVYAAQNATVTNGGTLEATQVFGGTPPIDAVIFGGGTNRLIVDPGAVFIGGVIGSGAVTLAPYGNMTVLGTPGGITTLELASATAAGTLSGLGTQYAGFAAVTIDSGANWTFSSYNTLGSGVTLTDSGTLTVGGTLPVGGTFTNAGLVTGAANGIVLTTGARVTNQSGGVITGTTDGIKLVAGGTITNQAGGTISGGTDAVQFAAGVTNRLVVGPGAVFIGSIVAAGTTTLELTSAAGAGSITGVGTTVTNFTSLVFDAGAAWTVGGNDAASGLGTLGISGFTVGDTIDLNSFSAVNRTFASNTLVLGNGIGGYETLHIQGNFGAGNFHLTEAGGDTDVTFVNPPVVTAGGTVTFTGGGSAVALDTGLTVSDLGSTTLVSATISFGTGFIAGDTLNFTAQHAITGSFSSGILTLTGSDTLADYQAALRSITYSFAPGNGDPTGGGADLSRLIDWSVNDGTIVSNTGTSTLHTVHTAPTVTASGTVSFAGGGSPIALDSGFVVTDPDSAGDISTATISIGTGFLSGDLLTFSTQNGITGSYTAGTGILTLSGTATIANYQAALESVTYSFSPANGDPTHGGSDTSRIIGWKVTDGSSSNGASNTGTSTIHATAASALIYGQTIAEVGIVATTETVATGVMTLHNAGGNTVGTIDVGTSLVTNDFTLVPIAGPGTDVIVDTVFGTYSSGVTLLVNPTTIASTAMADNTAAGGVAVTGPAGTAWTLTNLGSVAETGIGAGVGIAFAAAGTIINSGHVSGDPTTSGGVGISLEGGGVVTNQSGGTISGQDGILGQTGAITLVNTGAILGNPSIGGASGVYLGAGGSVTNQSGGTISGFYGVNGENTPATVVNGGVIAGYYTSQWADGIQLASGGSVTNLSTGTISGDSNGIRIAGGSGTVDNLGFIHSNDIPGQYGGTAIYLANGGAVTNGASGGTVSTAYILGYRYGVQFGASAAGTLTNFGTISGNPGNPAVMMAAGTIINGPSGATGALIEGGDQVNAVLITGVATVVNYARIIGVENPGDPNIYYGVRLGGASGSISNLGAHALIENYLGVYATDNDTVTNAGTIASNFAGGADALVFGGGINRLIVDPGATFIGKVSGGGPVTLAPSGNTTVIGTANGVGTTTLELASAASAGTLSGFGTQFVGFAAVTIDSSANWTFSGANTLIHGVTLTDSGALTASGTFTNAGLVTGAANGVVLTTGAHLTNQSGGTIIGSAIAVSASSAATVVNAGVISGNPTASGFNGGIWLSGGGSVSNQSGGTISGYYGVIFGGGGSATLSNAGAILGNPTANGGIAVYLGNDGVVTNQSGGTIAGGYGVLGGASSPVTVVNAGGISGRLAGVVLHHGGSVSNQSGGTITGYRAVYLRGGSSTVLNAGSIGGNTANGTGVDLRSGGTLTNQTGGAISGGTDAVLFAAGYTNRLVIGPGAAFTGTVTGGNSIGAASISTLELASGTSVGTLSGLGAKYVDFAQVTIDAGAAWMLSGSQTGFASLSNAGTVIGGITLGAGNFSVTNQPSATVTGIAGIVFGTVSDGTLVDSGTIIGTGGTAVSFGDGTNSMQLQPGALRIQGGVYGGAGISTLVFASGASSGTLTGVGAEFSGFSQSTIVAGATWVLAGANTFTGSPMMDAGTLSNAGLLVVGLDVTGTLLNTGSVSGYGGTAVSVASAGFVGNSGTGAITGAAGSYGYGVIAGPGGIGIYLSSGGVTNAAAITGGSGGASDDLGGGGGVGVDVIGGNLTNTASGTIAGGDGGGGYYNTNVDSYGAGGSAGVGVDLTSGSVTNTTLATIVGGAGGGGAHSAAVGGVGVDVSGGTLTNQGTISGGIAGGIQFGSLVGGGYGVVLTSGSVANQGTITGAAGRSSSAAGLFGVGGKGGGGITISGGSLTNATLATIIGGAGGPGNSATGGEGGDGIAVSGGSIVNQGTIIGGAAGSVTGTYHDVGGTGVSLDGGGFTNQNTIAGGTGRGRSGFGGYGINIQGGTLIDAGVIAGGTGTNSGGTVVISDAVYFGGAGRLILDPGASLVGAVVGDAAVSDVLELASGGAGSLAGFGTSITNLASLVLDAGAQWTVAGNDSASGLGTLGISGFTFGDMIDLAGFAATGATFANNALVLSAGTAHETLNIQGSFTTGNFVLTDVGTTATDITFQTAPLLYGDTIDEAGIVAATETVTGGLMTLVNGGGTPVGTIVVGASLSSGDFILRPDGAGGTDVIVDTVFGTYSSGVTLLVNPTTIASTAIVDNTAAGGVAVSGPGGTAWTLTNLGRVAETGVGAGVGIAFAAAGTIINSGGISGNASVNGGAGISLAAGGVVTNQSGGTINGWYGISAHTVATIVNAGRISGYATNGRGIDLYNGGVVTNLSSGVITGNQGVFSASSVVNAGTIIGNPTVAGGAGVDAGSGLSVTNQSGGVISGYQGIGDQRTIAVSNYGSIGGNATASGGAGLDLIVGATVVNHSGGAISGFTGAYVYAANVLNAGDIAGNAVSGVGISLAHGSVLTNQSGGTISGGTDAVKFAFGGNGRLVDDPGAVFIGAVVAADNATLELASGASVGTLSGLGSKYIGFGAVTIDTGADWVLGGSNTVVSGVTLTNSGTLTATGVLINAGTLTGNMLRLNGASLTNQAGGLVSAAYVYGVGTGGTDSVANSGTIISGDDIAIYLKAAGNISNAGGALISGYFGGVKLKDIDATLGNLGLVVSTGSLVTNYGAYLRNGGLVTNGQSGSGTSTASIQGYYGLTFKSADTDNAYGTLINYGTVRGSGTATGVGALLSNGGTVVNGQGGATGALIEGSRYGVSSESGPVTNGATIIATGTQGGDYGVAIQAYSSLGNIGAAALIEGYGGVLIGLDGTVTNTGTIASNQGTSGVAVKFIGGDARLIDDPGAVFIGSLYGGSGGTAVLELASGSSAGTIVGLGTSVTNFTSLVFDAEAQWDVAGNDAANGLGTLGISGFTSGDTIELTGFIAANHTFASNVLTLGDGVGDYETLHIPGGFVTGDFHTAVAGGNTDITFQVPPTITAGGTVTFDGGGAVVVLDSTLTVSDPNGDGNPTGATIIVGGPIVDGDTLNFGTLDGITGSYDDSTGTLTLTGTATALDYQAALDSITYSFTPGNGDPTDGGDVISRTISWTVDDGVASSTTGSSTLDLVHVAPTVIVGGTVTFTGGGGAVALDSGLTVSDPDSGGLLNSGTVHIVGFVSGDILSVNIADLPDIIANYNTMTGTLTLSGSDTLADYQAVLDSVSYSFNPSDGDPTDGEAAGSRGIDWSINDGVANSATGTSTLDLVYVAPTVTAGGTVSYAAGGPVAVLDPAITVSDPDSAGLLTSGTVAITDGTFNGDGDVLNADTAGTSISVNYDPATEVLVLSGSDTLADYQAVLASVSFSSTTPDPTNAGANPTRTISWSVDDGVEESGVATSTVDLTHLPPVISGAVGGQATTDAAALDPFGGVTITDPNTGQSETVTITLSDGLNGALSDPGIGALTNGSYSVSGTPLAVTGAIEGLVFTPTDHQVAPGSTVTTTFTISATDSNGGVATSSTTSVVATAVNDAPVIAGMVAGQTTTDAAALHPFSGVSISEVDFGQTETATITLSNQADGTLSNLDGGAFNNGTYTVTGTSAAVTDAIDGLVFTPTAHQVVPGSTVTTTFTVVATDTAGGTASNGAASVIATAANDAPVIAGTVGGQSTTDEAAISPFSGVSISDVDFGQTETVTVTLSVAANGTLASVDGGSYDGSTGVYSITGTDAVVSLAVDALVFTPTAHRVTPGSTVTTTFTIDATDTAGGTANNAATSVAATATNDAPVIAGTVGGQSTTDEAAISPFSGVSISDVDFGQTETVTVTLSVAANGALSSVDGGSYDGSTGIYSVTGTDAAVTLAVDALVFTPTAQQVVPGDTVTTTFTIAATDTAEGTSSNDATSVVATAGNDAPVIAGTVGGQSTTDEAAISPFSGVSIGDVDFGQTETVTVTLSVAASGTLASVDGGSYDESTGVYSVTGTDAVVTLAVNALVFTPTAHQVVPGDTVTTTFTIDATDTAGGTASNDATTVAATAANDAPVIAGTVGGQSTTDEAAISPFSGVSISDVDSGQTETVTVTLSVAANGTLASVNGGSYDGATGVYSVTGTDAVVTLAVDALVFTPTAQQVVPGDTVTTTFTIGATDTAGGTTSNDATSVAVTAANDAPVIAGTVGGQSTTDEAALSPFSSVSISDVDLGQTETVTVTLSVVANGALSSVNGGSYDGSTGVYSITGTDAAVTLAVDALVFAPTAHQVVPGGTVTTTFTIGATDTAGGTTSNDATSVAATAVNDAPAIAGTVAGQPTTDAAALHPFSDVSISEVDFGQTETATITLSNQADGTLSNLDGGTLNNGTYTVTGTSAAVTDAIDGLVFTPTARQVAPGSTVTTTFTIAVIDTAGGTASNDTTSVIATAANDAPVIAGAVGGQSTTDEAAISPFSGVSIGDVDFGQTETVTVTLSVAANGTLASVDGGSYDGSTGVYSVAGTDAAVALAVDALVFTPTAHQVVPGGTVTTTFTIGATDTAGGTASNDATSVAATAVADPAAFSGTLANPGVPIVLDTNLVSAPTPFSTLGVVDPDVGHTDTVTITLANPAFAVVSNLGGGSYDSGTGVYIVTGTAAEVTAAIDALVVTPPAVLAGGDVYVTSTDVTVDLVGTAGGPAPLTAILASAVQVLDMGSTPADNVTVAVSPDGASFPAPVSGDTNEAVVTDPTAGDTLTLPTGYQAEFLGGSSNVTLQDTSVGNAVLVGNTGNDVLIGGAANDSIIAGNGNNTLEGGSGTIALVAGDGNDSITTSADSTYSVTLGGGTDTVFANGSGTITGGSGSDLIDASGGGPSTSDTIVSQGQGSSVLGGAGALTVVENGAQDTIQAGSGATTVTLNGSLSRARGGTGNFTVLDQTASNTVIGGSAGTMFATVGAAASNSDVFGRAGDTNILDLGADALIGAGGGTSVVSIGGADTRVYGASPPGGTLNVSIGAANALVFGLGDNTTVDASNAAATGASVFGGFSSIAADDGSLLIQGGADSLFAVTGGSNSTIDAGTGGLYAYVGTGSIAGSNVINGASASALYVAFLGGAGSATVYGGEAAASVFGVDGSDVTYVDTLAGARGGFLVANGSAAGSETLNAAGSTTNDSLFAAAGNVSLVAGSGTDFLDAGANTGSVGGAGTVVGGDTMMAGGGSDMLFFSHAAFEGGAVVINFSSLSDTVILSGYNSVAGGNQASMALADATTAGGDTTIALADGTHITFVDATTAQLQGHLFST